MRLKQKSVRLRSSVLINAIAYRIPLPVAEVILYESGSSYPVCPRCNLSMEREYVSFCDRCGQHLTWERFDFRNQ